MKFIIKCAWCGRIVSVKESDETDKGEVISHSICHSCKAKLSEETDKHINGNNQIDDD